MTLQISIKYRSSCHSCRHFLANNNVITGRIWAHFHKNALLDMQFVAVPFSCPAYIAIIPVYYLHDYSAF